MTAHARTTTAPGPGAAPRAFALLGGVQTVLIFTLASLAVPLPLIGAELGAGRGALILLSAAYGLTFAGLPLFAALSFLTARLVK
ncbi:hypothetical protein [Streptomyces griseus]|uniref:hypothetical protein n=1 Tax=Streptomyces griseus TaxID=1911 RepID=UPI0004CC3B44|nr:hypothetical protein [Streptomyces griseus]